MPISKGWENDLSAVNLAPSPPCARVDEPRRLRQKLEGHPNMSDRAERNFSGTIWSFTIFAIGAAIAYLISFKEVFFFLVIFGSLLTIAVTTENITQLAASGSKDFPRSVVKFCHVFGFITKISLTVATLSSFIYAIYSLPPFEEIVVACGTFCYELGL
jgi:hypothetical protein